MDWVSIILDDAVGTENSENFNLKSIIKIEPSNGHVKPYSSQKIDVSIVPNITVPELVNLIIYTQFSIVSSSTFSRNLSDDSNLVEFAIKG